MRRNIIKAIAISLLTVMLVGCTQQQLDIKTTESGYVIEPGYPCLVEAPNMAEDLIYEVVNQPTEELYDKLIEEARSKTNKWWDRPETFQEPQDIVWMKVLQGDILGFQVDGYLFINADIEGQYNDTLATVIHEWIHLLNPEAYHDDYGVTTELLEMVVEAATVDIMGEVNMEYTTPCYDFFKSSRNLYGYKDKLIQLYKKEPGISVSRVCELLGWDYDAAILLNYYGNVNSLTKEEQKKFYNLVGK